MAKYYIYYNATRVLKSGPYTYQFVQIEQFAGSWKGVMKLDDQGQINELQKFASRLGIEEITLEQYEEELKKKIKYPRFSANIPTPPRPPQSMLNQNAGVVIKTPIDRIIVEDTRPTPENAILIGKAEYKDTLAQGPRPHYARSWQ